MVTLGTSVNKGKRKGPGGMPAADAMLASRNLRLFII
jgi:hypothetical protein